MSHATLPARLEQAVGPEWRVGLLLCSDSFRGAVTNLVSELGGGALDIAPEEDRPFPQVEALLVLAGGAEAQGLDLLGELRATVPRFLIGAAADHRMAAAAIQSGARDYFALPGDFDLLRRSLERLAQEAVEGYQELGAVKLLERFLLEWSS